MVLHMKLPKVLATSADAGWPTGEYYDTARFQSGDPAGFVRLEQSRFGIPDAGVRLRPIRRCPTCRRGNKSNPAQMRTVDVWVRLSSDSPHPCSTAPTREPCHGPHNYDRYYFDIRICKRWEG